MARRPIGSNLSEDLSGRGRGAYLVKSVGGLGLEDSSGQINLTGQNNLTAVTVGLAEVTSDRI